MSEQKDITNLGLDRKVVKTVEYPDALSQQMLESWAEGIPKYSEADPNNPEWKATPVIPIDLSAEGYGEVHVKDESSRASNPTGTIKDRLAWELVTLYADYARAVDAKIRAGTLKKEDLHQMKVPRLSLLTNGNEGKSVATFFERYNVPPPKIILGMNVAPNILAEYQRMRADVYQVDISQVALKAEDILRLTDNEGGVDITDSVPIEPHRVFYDWHVHEAFNENPDEIYAPYGSGRLMENYLYWQRKNLHDKDPRLKGDQKRLANISILGAEPEKLDSKADKLTAAFKPFLIFKDKDISYLLSLHFTGSNTGKYKVGEDAILQAHKLMTSRGIHAEVSAAAGLALYLERWEKKLVDPNKKVLIVNTGQGLEVK